MEKKSFKYLEVHPDKIVERGYHPDRHQVSESLFSLQNEYSGVRGYFDEGISNTESLRAMYLNGIYDYSREILNTGYRGIAKRTHFMINTVDIFKISIVVDSEKLDLNHIKFKDFIRELSFLTGLYTRAFTWELNNGKNIKIKISRLLSMSSVQNAIQMIELQSDQIAKVELSMTIDNNLKQWGEQGYLQTENVDIDNGILVSKTTFTNQKIWTKMSVTGPVKANSRQANAAGFTDYYDLTLDAGQPVTFTRFVTTLTSREYKSSIDAYQHIEEINNFAVNYGFTNFLAQNHKFYDDLLKQSDIEIEGNDEDLQGIRYCSFMLNSTYHGYNQMNNLGAKGLTGEAYSGHAFWDSETYCLPFFLFNNLKAAKDLILYRYHTLGAAKARARDLDCRGACFPIATLNGEEGCTLWQHASLQFQPSTGVSYALFHYFNITNDLKFIKEYGLELLKEINQFLLDRGQFNQDQTKFGYYGVMGPDEFKMMVNHNMYTNIMAKFSFDFMLEMLEKIKTDEDNEIIRKKLAISDQFIADLKDRSEKMHILFDDKTKLFEQNEGFYNLPHIDIRRIPREEFPLYSHWTYDRIYRGDMIKQPDVLMFLFLLNSRFSHDVKQANYEFYEPKTIHESSLSPSIHSIFASELGKHQEAINFFGYASRLDLDDYNNNTKEGIHLTSMAAAWMNIVYGFGGFRSDGKIFSIAPTIPHRWKSYTFKLTINERLISVKIDHQNVAVSLSGSGLKLRIYDKEILLEDYYECRTRKN
ncbi:MAG: glycosyl hydrolase family 65 protein [Bacilli bacterium]|jgi:maltose phosphorylase|nr:glycosyl hydrolase family 65 protein [Bacilli bacterium]